MMEGGRVAIAAILATGLVIVLVLMVEGRLDGGEQTLPLAGLMLSVVLLLLLPELMDYLRRRRNKED